MSLTDLRRHLGRAAVERLRAFELADFEHVVDYLASTPGAVEPLARALGVGYHRLTSLFGAAREPRRAPVPEGAWLPSGLLPPRRRTALAARPRRVRRALPTSASVVSQLGDVRDQGNLPTCVAHSMCTVREALERERTRRDVETLSARMLYASCKRLDGRPDVDGTWLSVACQVLTSDGVCRASLWPEAEDRTALLAAPSRAARRDARRFRIRHGVELDARDVDALREELARGRPVALGVPLYRATVRSLRFHREGRLLPLLPGDRLDGGHALVVCAYVANEWLREHGLPEEVGGGAFLLRNSWGEDFARSNPVAAALDAGPGLATASFGFVANHAWEACSLAEAPVARPRQVLLTAGRRWKREVLATAVRDARARLASRRSSR